METAGAHEVRPSVGALSRGQAWAALRPRASPEEVPLPHCPTPPHCLLESLQSSPTALLGLGCCSRCLPHSRHGHLAAPRDGAALGASLLGLPELGGGMVLRKEEESMAPFRYLPPRAWFWGGHATCAGPWPRLGHCLVLLHSTPGTFFRLWSYLALAGTPPLLEQQQRPPFQELVLLLWLKPLWWQKGWLWSEGFSLKSSPEGEKGINYIKDASS